MNSLDIMFDAEETIGSVPEKAMRTNKDVIQNIFTPEDVEILETLYCLWVAE